jgi:hypothetical protein
MVPSSEGESVGEREKVVVKEVNSWVGTGTGAVCVGLVVGELVGAEVVGALVGDRVVGALVGDIVSSAVSSKVRTYPVQFMLSRGAELQLKSRTPSHI